MSDRELSDLARLFAADECFRTEIIERVALLPAERQETFEALKTLYCVMEAAGMKRRNVCEQ